MQIHQVEYIRKGRTVICHVYAAWRGEQYRYTGISHCHPIDKFDLQLGQEIALSRALDALVKKMRRVTTGQVNMLDHNAHASHKSLQAWEAEKRRKLMDVQRPIADAMRRVPRPSVVEVAAI